MYRRLLFLTIIIVGIFFAIAVFAQTCPHVYEGINCGANWYCNGCQTTCKSCPGGGDPTGATELNYVSCACGCPSGQIVCSNACVTAPACSTPTREQNNSSCNGCGACKSGYAADPANPNPPSPCLKAAYIDYPNTGYFQTSGDLKSTGGDLYLANGKALRIDGAGTTTLNIGNFTGTSLDTTFVGGLVVKGTMALTSMGAGTVNAEKFCIAGDCRDVWPAAVSAFVQNGNTFGALAVLGTNDSYDLAIKTAGTEKMRLTTGGNFGIGTTAPAYKLDVTGQANATQLCITGDCRGAWPAPAGSDKWVQFNDGGVFGGSSGFIFDKTHNSLLVAGVLGMNGLGTNLTIGIQSRGSTAGGYFKDSVDSGYAYAGFDNYGVYGYGSLYGLYGLGGFQGVYGNGTDYGVYGMSNFTGVYGSGNSYGVYGATSFGTSDAGFFSNTSTSTYARLGYSTWGGYFGGNVNMTGNLTVGSGSSSDNDYIYFDDGSRSMMWENAMSRYYFDSGVFSAGQVSGTSVNAYSGGTVQTTDSLNQRAIAISHNSTGGLLETSSASPGINAGNLILRGDIDYPANYVDVQDELRVGSTLTVVGSATVTGKNVCLQDGTNCPASSGVPGGANTQVQYNNSGTFGGEAGMTYNSATDVLTVAGDVLVGGSSVCRANGFNCPGGGSYVLNQYTTGQTANFWITGKGRVDDDMTVSNSLSVGGNNPVQGITAKGTLMGAYIYDSADSGYSYVGYGNYGIQSYGSSAGVYGLGGTYGVYGSGAYGVYGTGSTYGLYGQGGTYGVYAQGTSYAGYFVGDGYFSGDVGIGTASPGALLDVQGAAQFGSGNINLIDSTGKIAGISSTYFTSLDGSALTNLNASNLASGTVSVARGGTNSSAAPTAGAAAYGTGSAYAFTAAGTSGQFLRSNGAGAPTWATIPAGVDGSGTANYLAKFTAGTTVGNSQIFDNATNVGIGTASPSYKLDVNGTLHASGRLHLGISASASGSATFYPPDGSAWFHIDTPGGATGSLRISQGAAPGGTVLMSVLQTGNVGIGITSPSYKLDVAGDIRVGTGTTGCVRDADGTILTGTCSSDERLKMNIRPIDAPILDKIAGLQIVNYNWRSDEFPQFDFGNQTEIGLIAQQVEKVFPELVETDTIDNFKEIHFEQMPFYLLKAVQEQQEQIDQLRSIICEDHPTEDFCKTK